MVERLANFGETLLNEELTDIDTTVTVLDGSVFPTGGNFRIVVDSEIMLVTARSSNDLTVTRGVESTTAVAHGTGANVKMVLTASGLTTAVGERFSNRWHVPAGSEVFSDEFDDASLDAGWTRVDTSSAAHLTYTEAGGLLSLAHNASADTAGPGHALMRAMPGGQSFPFTVQVGMRHFSQYATNYQMLGPILSNGIAAGAGTQVWAMPFIQTSHGLSNSLRSFTNWGTAGTTTSGVLYDPFDFHVRLRWTAANSFASELSPNGVDWLPTLTLATTVTPTHFGIAYSSWGIAIAGIGTYYYVRTY